MNDEKTSLTKTLEAVDNKAQYDGNAKKLLSHKPVLARIIKETMTEFKDSSYEEIINAIDGQPQVAKVLVHPGEVITGLPTENYIPNEKKVTYDVRFSIWAPDKTDVKLIVDIEAQKDFHPGYDIITRGIYYCARELSAQKGIEFDHSDYDSIKKVYSIWLIMNSPEKYANSITGYDVTKRHICSQYDGLARYDLMSVICVCLNSASKKKEEGTLFGFLSTLFATDITPNKKICDLEKVYGIKATKEMKEDIEVMCNLSEKIEEEATISATKKKAKEDANNLFKNGAALDLVIKSIEGLTKEEILEIYYEVHPEGAPAH